MKALAVCWTFSFVKDAVITSVRILVDRVRCMNTMVTELTPVQTAPSCSVSAGRRRRRQQQQQQQQQQRI
jgi:hypothetical protein